MVILIFFKVKVIIPSLIILSRSLSQNSDQNYEKKCNYSEGEVQLFAQKD